MDCRPQSIAAFITRHLVSHSAAATSREYGSLLSISTAVLPAFSTLATRTIPGRRRNHVLHAATSTGKMFRRLVVTLLQLLGEYGAVYSSIREIVGSAAVAVAGRNQVLYSSTFTTTVFGRLVATLLQLLEENGAFSVPAAAARLATRTRRRNSVRVLLACTGSVFRRSLS